MFISRQPTPFCGLSPTSHPSDPKHIACPYNYTHNDCSADSGEVVTLHPATFVEERTCYSMETHEIRCFNFCLEFLFGCGAAQQLCCVAVFVVVIVDVVVACNWLYISTPRRQQNRTESNNNSQNSNSNNSNAIMSLHNTHESHRTRKI